MRRDRRKHGMRHSRSKLRKNKVDSDFIRDFTKTEGFKNLVVSQSLLGLAERLGIKDVLFDMATREPTESVEESAEGSD